MTGTRLETGFLSLGFQSACHVVPGGPQDPTLRPWKPWDSCHLHDPHFPVTFVGDTGHTAMELKKKRCDGCPQR